MCRIFTLLLLSAACAWAQQPSTNPDPSQNPPSTAPSATAPGQQPTPTPQVSRQDKASVNSQIRDNIRSVLSGDPALSGTNVEASVDDVNIVLSGTVQSQGQMERVMQLVGPYIRYRQVVNKVQIR